MIKRLLVLIVLVGFSSGTAFSQTEEKMCGVANTSFASGESITYSVYYTVIGIWLNAGTANFKTTEETLDGHSVYHTVGSGWSNSKYDWIFKVRDRYESYYDRSNMLPLKFVRNVNEGKYKRSQIGLFNHNDGTVENEEKKTFKIPKCTHDIISALFNVRSMDFESLATNSKILFDMYLDGEVFHMYLRYLGKETIKTKLGTFHAIKVKPLLLKGNTFKGGEKMTAWISDDANHIPVRIESDLSVGSIKVDLMQYSGLRSTLSSRIK